MGQQITEETGIADVKASIGATALQMSTDATRLKRGIVVKALSTNAGIVYVGFSSSLTTSNGFPLAANESITLEVDSASRIWVIASTTSQEVRFLGV